MPGLRKRPWPSFAHCHRHVQTLERKIQRLEELVRLKDKKIETMRAKLEQANLA